MGVAGESPRDAERTLAGVAHLLILASLWGAVISLVIWWRERERSGYVGFHAAQAALYQIGVYILSIVFAFMLVGLLWIPFVAVWPLVLRAGQEGESFGAAGTIWLVSIVGVASITVVASVFLSLGAIAYGVYAAIQCFRGRPFRYVLLARIAERMTPEGSQHRDS